MKGDDISGYVFYSREGLNFSKKESELVLENVKRILSTRKGERINNPQFGSDIKKFLFLPDIENEDLVKEVVNSVTAWEPRVEVLSCTMDTSDSQEDIATISLVLRLKTSGEIAELSVSV